MARVSGSRQVLKPGGVAVAGLPAATTYTYRVRAFNGSGTSAYSNTSTATTLALTPAAPTTLTARSGSSGAGRARTHFIDLAWTAACVVDMLTLVEEIAVRKMDARLASWLVRQFAARRTEAAIVATHDEIAVELGTVREVVSRVLKELERKGAIRLFRGRIALVSEPVLSSLAAGTDIPAALQVSHPRSLKP